MLWYLVAALAMMAVAGPFQAAADDLGPIEQEEVEPPPPPPPPVVKPPPPPPKRAPEPPPPSSSNWWQENFEIHGFLTTKSYFRTPNFSHSPNVSSWRTELNLETALHIYDDENWRVDFYSVLRPTYDAVYEVQPDEWGNGINKAFVGTNVNDLPGISGKGGDATAACLRIGLPADCVGGRIAGEFTIINSDTGTLFTGERSPAISIDDVVFFGSVTAPVKPRGGSQPGIGGNATGFTYNTANTLGGLRSPALTASLAMASAPLGTPLNAYEGAYGDRSSLDHSSVDFNAHESNLKFDCLDNAHPWCFVREAYFEVEYKNTFLRIGKQQIVWGKTDAFRLQDKINPMDLGYHNVFPDLEERRIPQLSLDLIHSFGDVGPLQDVSLEFAWVFDRFLPDQFGQCGEPYAFTASCESRADAGGHSLFNFSLAGVEEHHWKIQNTEPGLRLEFRIPEPSIAFSFSAFYTFQDLPIARSLNNASINNPNPASMLFLQGFGLGGTIEFLAGAPAGTTPWTLGFDPYDHTGGFTTDGIPMPGGTLATANNLLLAAFTNAVAGCAGLAGDDLALCGAGLQFFALPWSASEFELEYPRYWALGASMDYQIPGIDTVLRLEIAADLDRSINDTSRADNVSTSKVFQAAIGLDRSTFIPFLNANRTAFISVQTFFEHIIDYRDNGIRGSMVPDETAIISTAFMQNYWRNDSIVLTNFVAVDWKGSSIIMGPTLRYIHNEHLFFDVGINVLWGKKRRHNIRNLCADGTLSCLANPATWQPGNWQQLNANLAQKAESPFFGLESFADKFMRNRDEFWLGVTYQF